MTLEHRASPEHYRVWPENKTKQKELPVQIQSQVQRDRAMSATSSNLSAGFLAKEHQTPFFSLPGGAPQHSYCQHLS